MHCRVAFQCSTIWWDTDEWIRSRRRICLSGQAPSCNISHHRITIRLLSTHICNQVDLCSSKFHHDSHYVHCHHYYLKFSSVPCSFQIWPCQFWWQWWKSVGFKWAHLHRCSSSKDGREWHSKVLRKLQLSTAPLFASFSSWQKYPPLSAAFETGVVRKLRLPSSPPLSTLCSAQKEYLLLDFSTTVHLFTVHYPHFAHII